MNENMHEGVYRGRVCMSDSDYNRRVITETEVVGSDPEKKAG